MYLLSVIAAILLSGNNILFLTIIISILVGISFSYIQFDLLFVFSIIFIVSISTYFLRQCFIFVLIICILFLYFCCVLCIVYTYFRTFLMCFFFSCGLFLYISFYQVFITFIIYFLHSLFFV